ncbi:hypothetical protein HPB51_029729 [Rhipicephalus microplus]|uniref:HTH psq-type domain-containing protein n=1 Tax=Rhipicephalus microplus TaxID=6941 RepID=A0A9J6CTR8_RHIMP|nr:hypothetical protein HPB51_029729 [Rhipicephalus microplus]
MEPMELNASANAVRHKAMKRKQISLKDKLDIIEQVEKGKKQVDVAMAYGLSKQTVSTIINAKEAVLAKKVSAEAGLSDLKFAVQVLSTVWAQIQPGIVKNCFRKAGFRVDSDCTDCLPQEDQPDPGVWSVVEEAFGSQQFSDYVTAYDDLVSSEQLTDEEIVAQIRQVPNAEQAEEQNEDCHRRGHNFSGMFTELSDLTALAVVRGPADTGVCRPRFSNSGAVQAAPAGDTGGTTAATHCVTFAGAEKCGAAPRQVKTVKEGKDWLCSANH